MITSEGGLVVQREIAASFNRASIEAMSNHDGPAIHIHLGLAKFIFFSPFLLIVIPLSFLTLFYILSPFIFPSALR